MNKTLIFLIISCSIFVLSAIVICIAPIINNIEVEVESNYIWKPSDWRNLNCAIFADKKKSDNLNLDELQKFKKYQNLCYRQKAMYGLEYSVFTINVILSFVCADLTLLHFLNIGKAFEKKTGLIGFISGIIGFVLTLVYVCDSGYIFNNDIAYGILDISNQLTLKKPLNLKKLYPNGAIYKWDEGKYVTVYDNDKGENGQYLLYKDLGQKQYNYDSEYYDTYSKNIITINNKEDCNINNIFIPTNTQENSNNGKKCKYLYYTPSKSIQNRYIYDRWLTSLILAVIIFIINIGLAIFGFLLFKSVENPSPKSEQIPTIYKK